MSLVDLQDWASVAAILAVGLTLLTASNRRFDRSDRAHAETRAELRAEIAAVRTDLTDTRTELKSEIAAVRSDLTDTRAELKTEIADTRAELKTEIADTRAELKAEIAETRHDLGSRLQTLERRTYDLGRASGPATA